MIQIKAPRRAIRRGTHRRRAGAGRAGCTRSSTAAGASCSTRAQERQAELDAGETLDFVTAPEDFTVAPVPDALQDRRVEITGPDQPQDGHQCPQLGRARVHGGLRGLELALLEQHGRGPGQPRRRDQRHHRARRERQALRARRRPRRPATSARAACTCRSATFRSTASRWPARSWTSACTCTATPRRCSSAAGGRTSTSRSSSRQAEAALWRDAFVIAEEALGLDRGTIKATVLIETIPAAFAMDAILYELRDHAAGLNAGRWDYIFSMIKRFRSRPEFVLPDRSEVTMTVPFMKAYSDLVVKTCHARGAHAMGGMAAVIPSRTDEEANRARLRGRASRQGARGERRLRRDLGRAPRLGRRGDGGVRRGARRPPEPGRQAARRRVAVRADALLDVASTPGERTEEGLRSNVNVGIQYLSSWLRGNGAAGDLRPDGGRRHGRDRPRPGLAVDPPRSDPRRRPPDHARAGARAGGRRSWRRSAREIGDDEWFEREGRPDLSRSLFERVALSEEFVEFLTLPAYEELLKLERAD